MESGSFTHDPPLEVSSSNLRQPTRDADDRNGQFSLRLARSSPITTVQIAKRKPSRFGKHRFRPCNFRETRFNSGIRRPSVRRNLTIERVRKEIEIVHTAVYFPVSRPREYALSVAIYARIWSLRLAHPRVRVLKRVEKKLAEHEIVRRRVPNSRRNVSLTGC